MSNVRTLASKWSYQIREFRSTSPGFVRISNCRCERCNQWRESRCSISLETHLILRNVFYPDDLFIRLHGEGIAQSGGWLLDPSDVSRCDVKHGTKCRLLLSSIFPEHRQETHGWHLV
jgi:hypothetical protein